ncbi:ABC transporter permease, partial [Chitinophaga sp.]|uniref:ABC transporter permease n=1 Tax=Chitinophaga sp. TaxID=1869181 RepID=UPI002B8CF901
LINPVCKTITMWGRQRKIAGVVKDFNFESLHQEVKPFAIRLDPLQTYRILVKVKMGKDKETVRQIKQVYQQYDPGFPFDYKFLDKEYQAQYATEGRVAVLSKYFAGLAILISCLGLFGLAAFTAQRRRKEIGIRKVLGASAASVLLMLSRDFVKLVLVAVLIAFPLSWWIMNHWLNGFAYRIHIGTDVFLIATISTLLITIFTISFQAISASLTNPVKSLKSE